MPDRGSRSRVELGFGLGRQPVEQLLDVARFVVDTVDLHGPGRLGPTTRVPRQHVVPGVAKRRDRERAEQPDLRRRRCRHRSPIPGPSGSSVPFHRRPSVSIGNQWALITVPSNDVTSQSRRHVARHRVADGGDVDRRGGRRWFAVVGRNVRLRRHGAERRRRCRPAHRSPAARRRRSSRTRSSADGRRVVVGLVESRSRRRRQHAANVNVQPTSANGTATSGGRGPGGGRGRTAERARRHRGAMLRGRRSTVEASGGRPGSPRRCASSRRRTNRSGTPSGRAATPGSTRGRSR